MGRKKKKGFLSFSPSDKEILMNRAQKVESPEFHPLASRRCP